MLAYRHNFKTFAAPVIAGTTALDRFKHKRRAGDVFCWSDDEVKMLGELWRSGAAYVDIAGDLSIAFGHNRTKSSVCGMCQRLGLLRQPGKKNGSRYA